MNGTIRTTILNGALPEDGFTDRLQGILASELAERGHRVQAWTLRDEKIAYCIGCFECWTRYPGLCRIDDTGREVTASIINSDLTVYLSPVTFGGYSSELKKALDRSICLILPFFLRVNGEVHHRPRYEKYPRLLGLGVLPAPDRDQEDLFRALLNRNAINLHAPANAAGFVYRRMGLGEVREGLDRLLREVDLAPTEAALEESR